MDILPSSEDNNCDICKEDERTVKSSESDLLKAAAGRTRSGETKKRQTLKIQKKLKKVTQENESLASALNLKNAEITDLKYSIKSLNEVLNSVPIEELRDNSSIASTKILDLCKKNRQLRAELEIAKNRIGQRDVQIRQLEREMKQNTEKLKSELDGVHDQGKKDKIDDIQTKYNVLQQKLFESRNKNLELRNQLNLAQKCLQQELGENVSLTSITSQNSGWRGRAQQILNLQKKVNEYKERLESYEQLTIHNMREVAVPPLPPSQITEKVKKDITTPKSTGRKKMRPKTSPTYSEMTMTSMPPMHETPYKPAEHRTVTRHRVKVDALEKEIAELKTNVEEANKKITALKVRNKTLNDEVVKYKVKVNTLEEQSEFSGMNLNTINEQINKQKYRYEVKLEELNRKMHDIEKERRESEIKGKEMAEKLQDLEETLNEKESKIVDLYNTIESLERNVVSLSNGFLFSCQDLQKDEYIAILEALEREKDILMEQNRTLLNRTEQERQKNDTLTEQCAKLKVRVSRLEAKIRELERDQEDQKERKKRSQRIADYTSGVSSSGSITGLPVNSLIFENQSLASLNSDVPLPQIADLKNQLEYANEKIMLLESKVSNLSEEKQNDAIVFEQIVANSKSVVLDTIKTQRLKNDGHVIDDDVSSDQSYSIKQKIAKEKIYS